MRNVCQEEHIQHIVTATTSADPNLLCFSVAQIQGLSAALQQWTGGSPRLMVYSLRVLHHLLNEGKTFGSAEHAMEAVFEILKDQQAVAIVRCFWLRMMRLRGKRHGCI